MLTAPRFWWRPRPGLAAFALAPVSAVWGSVAGARMRRSPAYQAPVPVICIGNFVIGGAGKTPTALAVAEIARRLGRAPGFLTRGYGGTVRGAALVDLAGDTAARVGDEALLLAASGPVAVAADRPKGVPLLIGVGADIVIMDDGFQNPSLAKDLSLVVVDGTSGIGNGLVTPSGPLRAPFAVQIERADAVIIVGAGAAGEAVAARARRAGRPVLRAGLVPDGVSGWDEGACLAFAGIGRPEKFFASLAKAGARIAVRESFPDHQPYGDADAARLLARARAEGLRLVTTSKDHARLLGSTGPRRVLAEAAEIFGVRMVFEDETRIAGLIERAIALRG